MYESFFGLREKPFNMTPDPAYLFFADQHREAFAHLVYGIRERRGFIAITGEVGAGKTTLCRAMLNEFDQNTRIALILNPMLSDVELLRAICDELFVDTEGESKKQLLDALNAHLIEQHSAGKNVVLIIDEAQNLSDETLEQIRIISNLETVKAKLIQIVLVGQPELGEKLARKELRQLNQRITVRYHLSSLSRKDTENYIAHRLRVAGSEGKITFTKGALKEIYRFSQGVPRKINTICDHALLTAFVREILGIDRMIVKKAWQEIEGPYPKKRKRLVPRWALPTGAAVAAGLILASAAFFIARNQAWLFDSSESTPAPRYASVQPIPSIDEDQATGEEVEVGIVSTPAPEESTSAPEGTQPDQPLQVASVTDQSPEVDLHLPTVATQDEAESPEVQPVDEAESPEVQPADEAESPKVQPVEAEPTAKPVLEPTPEAVSTLEESIDEATTPPAKTTGSIWAAVTTESSPGDEVEPESSTPDEVAPETSSAPDRLQDVELEIMELPVPGVAGIDTKEAYGDGEFDAHGVLHTGSPARNNMASLLTLAFRWHPEEFPIYEAYRSILEEDTTLKNGLSEMGLELRQLHIDLDRMCLLDLPAAIEIQESPYQPPITAVVLEASPETLLVSIPSDGERKYSRSELQNVWTGRTWLCLPFGETEHKAIGPETTGPAVQVLESRLSRLGFHDPVPNDRYDEHTKAAVNAFQEKYGLEVNGMADAETQILLFALTSESGVPSLNFQLASGNR